MTNTTLEKWEEKSIKQLAVLICDGDWIETKNQSFNGIRLIQTGNIGEGCYKDKTENARYISEETFKKLNCTEIFSGDCLVSRLPQPLGRACIIPYKNERMITAVDCSIIRFNNKVITPKYFIYYSMSDSYNKKVTALSTGATRQRISRKNLETITIPLPPLPEQERIVARLDKAFEAIDKVKANAEQNLNNAKELFESSLNKAFTENNEGWEERTLEKACKKISAGGDKPEKFSKEITEIYNVPIYSNGIENDGLYGYTDVPAIVDEAITISARGTIGFVCKRAEPYYPIVRLISAIPNDYINIDFMVYALQFMVPTGNGSSIPQLTVPMLKNKMIKYPSLLEQQKIVDKLDVLQEQTKQLEQIYTQKIKECDELKQSILQKAFRGEL